jgi:hypothetical protein
MGGSSLIKILKEHGATELSPWEVPLPDCDSEYESEGSFSEEESEESEASDSEDESEHSDIDLGLFFDL